MSRTPSILFACIHSSGRSVAAEVLARHHAGGSVEVRSAGSQPGAGVNPVVARVLAERGSDGRVRGLRADLIPASR